MSQISSSVNIMDSPHKHRHLPASSPRTSLHCPHFLPSHWSSCLHTFLWLAENWHFLTSKCAGGLVSGLLLFSPDFISWRFAMSWHEELTRSRQDTHVWPAEKVKCWNKMKQDKSDSIYVFVSNLTYKIKYGLYTDNITFFAGSTHYFPTATKCWLQPITWQFGHGWLWSWNI